jgi:hypothetical protein
VSGRHFIKVVRSGTIAWFSVIGMRMAWAKKLTMADLQDYTAEKVLGAFVRKY